MSSPGPAIGRFYDAFTRHKQFYKTFSVTAYDCPHLSQSWIAQQVQKYGESSPLIRSMIFAEFEKDGQDGTLIPLRNLEDCLENPPAFEEGPVHAFCDFAAGGDENVFAVRRGNRVEIVKTWRDRNTMAAVGEFIRLFRSEKLRPREISGDGSGLGKPICDRLKEEGWRIHPVNNGGRARPSRHYVNKGTEIWATGARLIENREIILPHDDALIAQLSSRRAALNSKGQLQLESKSQMKSRGISSPDRADAVLGAMIPPRIPKILFA
ncbi:MAG: phage terminase large subunit [Verrucomicrobiales bacterium]|jgi:phage terminase large subunit